MSLVGEELGRQGTRSSVNAGPLAANAMPQIAPLISLRPRGLSAASSSRPYLEIRGLTRRFGRFVAVQDVGLAVSRGEFLVLLGPSGCGKTTLLRLIAGLERQDYGEIFQDGREISGLVPALRDFGIVFQSYALFPNLTVEENVAYGLIQRARRGPGRERFVRSRVEELLQLVGLPGSNRKYPAQLSGGQQQRVALARALATSPGLLLLDEPLSALDATERLRLRGEIRQLQSRLGVTTIMVTHDQEEALSMADRVVVMKDGRIQQEGHPEAIYRRPANEFVANFIGRGSTIEAVALDEHRLRWAGVVLRCAVRLVPNRRYRFFIRPEEVRVHGVLDSMGNDFFALVDRLEFHGSGYLVTLSQPDFPDTRITALFANNYLAGRRLVPGSLLRVDLPEETLIPLAGIE